MKEEGREEKEKRKIAAMEKTMAGLMHACMRIHLLLCMLSIVLVLPGLVDANAERSACLPGYELMPQVITVGDSAESRKVVHVDVDVCTIIRAFDVLDSF